MAQITIFRSQDPTLDLKAEIFQLKKELHRSKQENQLFKVKIRKLHDDVTKRDKQIQTLLNPSKSTNYKRLLSEKQVTLVFSLSQEIEQLKLAINEKNNIIKKLQNELNLTKLYTSKSIEKKRNLVKRNQFDNKLDLSIPYYELDKGLSYFPKGIMKSNSLSELPIANRAQLTKFTPSSAKLVSNVLREHIPQIEDELEQFDKPLTSKLNIDPSHEEMKDLQDCFLDVIAEVDQLKQTVSIMNGEKDITTTPSSTTSIESLKQKSLPP